MSEFRQVTKEEFNQFVDDYPNKLDWDVCGFVWGCKYGYKGEGFYDKTVLDKLNGQRIIVRVAFACLCFLGVTLNIKH